MPAQKVYYSIKEVSELTGLPFPTLRFWENTFPELSPKRNSGKTRFYTEDDIATIQQIKFLRDVEKLSIPTIARRLKSDKKNVDSRMQAIQTLQKLRQELVDIRTALRLDAAEEPANSAVE